MSAFYAFYPPGSAASANASVGVNGATSPSSSTLVAGQTPGGLQKPLQTDASGNLLVSPVSFAAPQHVIVDSSALPTGASSSALQSAGNTSIASIDTKTPALGQALAAASVPVVLTAAQIATLTPLSTVAVTGPLTDTQLRATPVPVSTGGLTDTQLRASAVPVSLTSTTVTGTVAVTGPLTDTQLRASAVPVTANAGTNLNTSALNLETTQAAMSAKLPATLGQKTMSASMAVTIASDQSTITASVPGKTVGTAPVYTDYTSTPVTTAAYTQLVASTGAAVTHLSIFDGSGQAMIIATGAAASEVIKLYVPPGGGEFDLAIPAGTRIAIKALTASATSSYQLLNMLS